MSNIIKAPIKLFIDASPMAEDHITGIPHFTFELVRALDRHPGNGKRFNIILLIAFDKKRKLNRWKFKNVKIKSIPLPLRMLNLLWKYKLLPPMDLFMGKGAYLFPNYKNWQLHNSFSLTYIHDLGYIRYPDFVQPKNLTFLKDNMKLWVDRSDMVLTGSDHARDEIIDLLNVSPEKVIRIYHGVDHSEYYPRKKKEIQYVKKKYGIINDYLLYVGSLEPRKNLIRLLSAYRKLPKELTDQYSLCLVAGGGWLNDDIIRAIDDAQRAGYKIIRPARYVEDIDLPALMSGAALLTHPALYEGFGLSPLQAMACGAPVLVGGNSSLPEVVGKAGIIVDAGSETDISNKIERALVDRAYQSRLRDIGYAQSKKFNWDITASLLIKQLERGYC